jgi:RHH-type rel operon transcriptional repressor/antitoxin RelB
MPSLRLPQEIDKRLDRLAEVTGRTKTFYMMQAIMTELKRQEEIYLPEVVREREKGGDLVSAEEVRKGLNMVGSQLNLT